MSSALFYFSFFLVISFSAHHILSAAIWDDRGKCFFQLFSSVFLRDKMENHTLSAHKKKLYAYVPSKRLEIALITFCSPQTRHQTHALQTNGAVYIFCTLAHRHATCFKRAQIKKRNDKVIAEITCVWERERERMWGEMGKQTNEDTYYQTVFSHGIQQIKVKL